VVGGVKISGATVLATMVDGHQLATNYLLDRRFELAHTLQVGYFRQVLIGRTQSPQPSTLTAITGE
jgi:hypothetical protein